jgi:FkbM family methyltransferase
VNDWGARHEPDHDFSQSGEQKWIQAFADRSGPGRFLDIGAYDGVTGSNSRWLALHGWEGVCVEPAAAAFHALAELYHDRQDVMCVQALVGRTAGLQRFWYSPTDLVSTTENAHYALWQDAARFVDTVVCQVTLDELLAYDPGRFDVVSIDTEGTSIELLQTLRGHLLWGGFGLLVVEFADGEQEYEIHDICGVDEWAVCERTSNNVVLERIQWFDVTPLGAPERTEINAAGETRTRPFEATDGAP